MHRGLLAADAHPADLPKRLDCAIDSPSPQTDGGPSGRASGARTGVQEMREVRFRDAEWPRNCAAVPCVVDGD